ncbi:MAG TPA: DUF4124 domain-containing protein [Casimicrobiaceae bacterium]|nr:DUF4124 domain-containing protein [Casimicrobiaceae bacterium]
MTRFPPLDRPSSLRRRVIGAALGLTLASAAALAHAGIYKCERDDGSVMYQEDPCAAGRELRDFDRDPPSVSVVPFRIPPSSEKESTPKATPARASGESKSRKSEGRQGNAGERKFLIPGIGEGEVVARVGRPDMSTGGGRKTVRWTYLPTPDDPQTITTLTFEFGRLIEVERKVVRTP